MSNEKSVYYNKTTSALIWGTISSICFIILILGHFSRYLLDARLILILINLMTIALIMTIRKFHFYVDSSKIRILLKNIYWQDIRRVEVEEESKKIYIEYFEKIKRVNFLSIDIIEFLLAVVFLIFSVKYFLVIYINYFSVMLTLFCIAMLCVRFSLIRKRFDLVRFGINKSYANQIINAIRSAAYDNRLTQTKDIIDGKYSLVLTKENLDNKQRRHQGIRELTM